MEPSWRSMVTCGPRRPVSELHEMDSFSRIADLYGGTEIYSSNDQNQEFYHKIVIVYHRWLQDPSCVGYLASRSRHNRRVWAYVRVVLQGGELLAGLDDVDLGLLRVPRVRHGACAKAARSKSELQSPHNLAIILKLPPPLYNGIVVRSASSPESSPVMVPPFS